MFFDVLMDRTDRNGPESRPRDDNHEYGEDRPQGMDPDGVIEVCSDRLPAYERT